MDNQKRCSKAFINTDFNGNIYRDITLRPLLAYIECGRFGRADERDSLSLSLAHDTENVISMHADNKYGMMEMRKTLNQIKATTKSSAMKRLKIHAKFSKKATTQFCSKM